MEKERKQEDTNKVGGGNRIYFLVEKVYPPE